MNNQTTLSVKPGAIFKSRTGGEFTIISKSDRKTPNGYNYYWNIKFNDKHGYETTVEKKTILSGLIRNPYAPNAAGIGYIGVGKHKSKITDKNGKMATNPIYKRWIGILERCYVTPKTKKGHISYTNVTVAEEWHNFQNFADWFTTQPEHVLEFEIDKDLLSSNAKIYSKETCVLLPKEINMLLVSKKYATNKYSLPKGIRYTEYGRIQATVYCGNPNGIARSFRNIDDAIQWYNEMNSTYINTTIDKYADILEPKIIKILKEKVLKNCLIEH